MASDQSLYEAQLIIPYMFKDLELLRKALTAGDTNSDDREGNRSLAQVGDALMSLVIKYEGFRLGLSRKELEDYRSVLTSKVVCSVQATALGLTPLVKFSERQIHDGPQPGTLKNTLAAIVAAVWMDSQRQYNAAVGIMAFLGLVNDGGSYIEPQETGANWRRALVNGDWFHSDDLASTSFSLGNVDFEALLDTDLLGSEWMSVSYDTDLGSAGLAADLEPGSDETLPFATLERNRADEVLAFNGQPDGSLAMAQQAGNGRSQNIQLCEWDQRPAEDEPGVFPIHSITEASTSTGAANATKRRTPSKGKDIRLVFKAYLSNEAEKLKLKDGLFRQHYAHMHSYQETLSRINTPSLRAVATMALAIGDCSAMEMLKQAIQSIRTPSPDGSFRVKQDMSCEDRLDAIHRLDLRMANLRIARWLHIYKLFEDLSDEIRGKDADGFIILTNADLESTEARTLARRGNPRNLEQATITKRMLDHLKPDDKSGTDRKKSESSMKRLRRVGQRLRSLVNRWGLGILCLLGPRMSDEMYEPLKYVSRFDELADGWFRMMHVADDAFTEFLKVVDQFEGRKIQAVSEAARAAVQLFMDDGAFPAKLRIESVDQKVLGQLPRLSSEMQELFKVTSGG